MSKQKSASAQTSVTAILVINCGSSSVKFSLIQPRSGTTLLSGLAECLTTPQASIKVRYNVDIDNQEQVETSTLVAPFDHQVALNTLVNKLVQLNLVDSIVAIGHRVVHGGEHYAQPTLINTTVKKTIEKLAKLAPLHNPANIIGINACQQAFATLPQVAIFDTAFHQSMPEKAYLYGLPIKLYQEHSIRRYGFHGTSHYFVANQAAKLMSKPLEQCNLISAHLGNGCSVTVIKNGQSVDTSMGMTPLEGIMMGTRSGDIDAGIIFHLVEQLGFSIEQVDTLLNKKSGLFGLSELSNDCRTLETVMLDKSHPQSAQATLALTVFCYRIAKSIASFSASLSELDGLIFTGGIGENSSWVRQEVVNQLGLLNFHLCEEKNQATRFGSSGDIAINTSRPCWVIGTNEEWVIAEQSAQLLTSNSAGKL
ncbi:acetate kinase [Candidatus Colwellia aromaticivorans]|uniref:acetate kinase n=1 Tax=Candidatus Colwellia aromaticivorans TaxID=2267621 RepID=UPI000DF1D9DF|nr:acetate kinase [Candidatus Colwellia aromaticivorans]